MVVPGLLAATVVLSLYWLRLGAKST